MAQHTTNFISQDVEITGTVTFGEALICHGTITGEILSTGRLTVAPTGTINGDIETVTIAIQGKVNGNVTATEKCELDADAQLIGDLKAPRLAIAAGATFIGKSEVVPATSNVIPLSANRPAPTQVAK